MLRHIINGNILIDMVENIADCLIDDRAVYGGIVLILHLRSPAFCQPRSILFFCFLIRKAETHAVKASVAGVASHMVCSSGGAACDEFAEPPGQATRSSDKI